jgi:hypothetical protein
MNPRTRLLPITLCALALPLLTACDAGRIEELEAQNAELTAQLGQQKASNSKLADDVETAKAELATREGDLQEAKAQLTDTNSQLANREVDLQQARAQLTDANSQLAAAENTEKKFDEKLAKESKQRREAESHRDELIEWIEDDLLPLAEQHDPRLANLKQITDEMAKEVERLRGLKFKRPFMRRLIDRDDVSKFMRRDMERDLPREEAEKMMAVLAEFGIVDKGMDLFELFEQFLEAGAAAFYKPNTGTFYLIEGKNDQGDRPIVFHELVHALEDQHFDLTNMQRKFDGDSDGAMGYKALVEGSAEHFTNLYTAENPEDLQAMLKAQMTPDMMRRQMQMVGKVPAFLIAMMGLYPYKNGAAWIEGIEAGTPEGVSGLFADPPASTEQVLHPDKHGKDFPHRVAAPDVEGILGDGWEVLDDDGVGELGTGLILSALRWNPKGIGALMAVMDMRTQGVGFKPPIKAAAEGWDGDRYTAAIDGDRNVCIVWTTVWDSDEDAAEFAKTYGELIGKRVTGQKVEEEVGTSARFSVEAGMPVSGVETNGKRVVCILSAPADQAEVLIAAGMAAEITPDARDEADSSEVADPDDN